jgi:hypothetical protein
LLKKSNLEKKHINFIWPSDRPDMLGPSGHRPGMSHLKQTVP